MGSPIDEIDDPELGETVAGSMQQRGGPLPDERRLQCEEREKNQTDSAQQQPGYDQPPVSEPIDQLPGKHHHRDFKEGPGAQDKADLQRGLQHVIQKVAGVGERGGGHHPVEKNEEEKPSEKDIFFQMTPRDDDRGSRRPGLDSGPGDKSQYGERQRCAVEDQRGVAEIKEQAPHQDRRNAPSVGAPQPVGAVELPPEVFVEKHEGLRIQHRYDRIEEAVQKKQQDEDVDEFAVRRPVVRKILADQSDQRREEGDAETEEGYQVLSRMEFVRQNPRRDVRDQADQRHHEEDESDQTDGGGSIRMDDNVFVEDAEKRRADSEADEEQKEERFQVGRLFLDGIHEAVSASGEPGSCSSG